MTLNAGELLDFARGATWHLDVARAQSLAVAARESSPVLEDALRTHLTAAASDLSTLRSLAAATGDADGVVRAVSHLDTTPAALRALAAASAPELAATGPTMLVGAVSDAQRAVENLLPLTGSDARVLPVTPLDHVPAGELDITDGMTARAFHASSSEQRQLAEHILRDGTIQDPPLRWVSGNSNFGMRVVRVAHPDNAAVTIDAVERPPNAQAAQEELVYRLATALGVDRFYAPMARRADGSALVAWVPGMTADRHGIAFAGDVQDTIANWYRQHVPSLGEGETQRAARIDRQLTQFIDWLVAHSDRHPGNTLGDRAAGVFHHIDTGYMGRGETADPLRPALKGIMLDGDPHVQLDPDTVAVIRERLTDDVLADAHAVLSRPAGELGAGQAADLARDASPEFLARMTARRDHVLATGGYDYTPLDLWADPLRAPAPAYDAARAAGIWG